MNTAGALPESEAQPDELHNAARATTGGVVLTAGLWATASRLLPQIYSLAMSVVAARFLGPDGMGKQSLIAFAAIFTTAAATLGVPTALMRYVGERVGAGESDTVGPLVRAVWRVELAAAVIGAAVLFGIALRGAEPQAAWILAGCTAALGVLQKVPTSALIGLQRWREASAVTMVMGAVAMVATIVVLAAGGGVTGMIAVGTASTFVILLWTTIRLHKRLSALTSTPRRDPTAHRRMWRYAAIASLGVPVTLIVWFRSEFFFLARYSSDTEIALYSIAFSAYTAVVILPQSLANAIAPAFATLFGAQEEERIQQGFGRAMRLLLTATLPLTALTMSVGPETLRTIYGEDYRGTGVPLLIMLAVLPFIPLLQTSMSLLVGVGRQWVPLLMGVAAALANITLDIVLIPRYAAVGAALANAVAQTIAAFLIITYAVHVARGVTWEIGAIARATLAAAISAVAAVAAVNVIGGLLGVAVGIAAWMAIYGAAIQTVRILSPGDVNWLDTRLQGRVRSTALFLLTGKGRVNS